MFIPFIAVAPTVTASTATNSTRTRALIVAAEIARAARALRTTA